MNLRSSFLSAACALALALTTSAFGAQQGLRVEMNAPGQAGGFGPDLQKQDELLAKIQSPSTPAAEKAISCKRLVIHGTAKAVPVLTPLLSDPQMASWARIALEAIPGPEVDAALRKAMERLEGDLLIGVINSIGVRGDARAVRALRNQLKNANPEVVAATAVALGKIGGDSASKSLLAALKRSSEATSGDIAEGCIRCAELFLVEGKPAKARELYDAVRAAQVPPHRILEATRGAILARGEAGIPMLLEELRATDKDRFGIGLRTARELPGRKVTETIATELNRTPAERQPHLLLALADREDPAGVPAIVNAARPGPKALRLVAVQILERQGNLAAFPVLVDVAIDSDPELSQAALGALTRLPAEGVETELLARLSKASGREREVLIQAANRRQMRQALKPIVASVADKDPAVRKAALQAVGSLGSEEQLPSLLEQLKLAQSPAARAELETAIETICSRSRAAIGFITPLARSSDPDLRSLALRCCSASGGAEALGLVRNATRSEDADFQDEAVRVLANWPSTWPEDAAVAEPLLELARSGQKDLHKVLALRGYLQYIEGDPKLKAEQKLTKVREVFPLVERPEEKRLAVSVLGNVGDPQTVEVLLSMASDDAVREDACSALLKLGAREVSPLPKPVRIQALQMVVEKSAQDRNRKRAQDKLQSLQ